MVLVCWISCTTQNGTDTWNFSIWEQEAEGLEIRGLN